MRVSTGVQEPDWLLQPRIQSGLQQAELLLPSADRVSHLLCSFWLLAGVFFFDKLTLFFSNNHFALQENI